jgi:hypothetical protein
VNWLRRWITLPKDKNSLDDLVTPHKASLMKAAARTSIKVELHRAIMAAAPDTQGLMSIAEEAVERALGGKIPAVVRRALHSEVVAAFESSLNSNVLVIQSEIAKRVYRLLDLEA